MRLLRRWVDFYALRYNVARVLDATGHQDGRRSSFKCLRSLAEDLALV